MRKKRPSIIFRILKKILKFFYKKMEFVGLDNIPSEPTIIVGNHAQMDGPITCEIYFPDKKYIWCTAEMMNLREVPAYAFQDFWSNKPQYVHWFYKILSYIIAPLSVFVFNNACTIPVYKDSRIVNTFKNTIDGLNQGANIVIFPEHTMDYNNIICDFQENFIQIAKFYYKETKKEISFVPMYLAPRLKKAYIGKTIKFNANEPIKEERKRIKQYLMDEITNIARSLPEHTVVPYKNIPKKDYPTNIIDKK